METPKKTPLDDRRIIVDEVDGVDVFDGISATPTGWTGVAHAIRRAGADVVVLTIAFLSVTVVVVYRERAASALDASIDLAAIAGILCSALVYAYWRKPHGKKNQTDGRQDEEI